MIKKLAIMDGGTVRGIVPTPDPVADVPPRPAILRLGGAGERVSLGQLFSYWSGVYPFPAFTLWFTVTPSESTPSTPQQLLGSSSSNRGIVYVMQDLDGALFVSIANTANAVAYRSIAAALDAGTEYRIVIRHNGGTGAPRVWLDGAQLGGTMATVTDLGDRLPTDEFWLGDAGRSGTFDSLAGSVRQFAFVQTAAVGDSLDSLLAANDTQGVDDALSALGVPYVWMPFLTSDNGANGGSIQDLAGGPSGTPVGTVSGDLTPVT